MNPNEKTMKTNNPKDKYLAFFQKCTLNNEQIITDIKGYIRAIFP